MINKKQLQANMFLLTTAIIWGFAFVAQRAGMDHIGPFMFSGLRFLLGAIALVPVIMLFGRLDAKNQAKYQANGQTQDIVSDEERRTREKYTLKGGLVCGGVLFAAASIQQIGLVYTTAGKTAFITALYIILVPIFSIFLKRKLGLNVWVSAVIAAVGLYLLCIKTGFTIEFGDLIVLIGSIFWALHILVVDHFVARVYAIKMSAYQFVVAGLPAVLISLFIENPTLSGILEAAFPIVFVGIFSCGIAFTFQVLGQKNATPTTASLILSMEAVFGAIGGYLFLSELLTAKELIGCALMLIAVILSQLPVGTKSKSESD